MRATITPGVIRYLTDRPNEIVHKLDVTSATGFSSDQITTAIRTVQRTSPIGPDIRTLVRGNAWRYAPVHAATVGKVNLAPDTDVPTTTLICQFFVDHPHAVVVIDHLVAYTGRQPDQVQVGVNNTRRIGSHNDVTRYLTTVVQGQMWRYDPPSDSRPRGPVARLLPPSPVDVRPTTVVRSRNQNVAATVTDELEETIHDGRMFEEVGSLSGGRIVIRDQDDNMYTATPLS